MRTNVERIGLFSHSIKVEEKDIDELNHVNNKVYLDWLMDASGAHSASLGYTMDKYFEMGCVFVVRRHELDYLRSALFGDELVVNTWIDRVEGARCERMYEIIRVKDQKPIMTAKTLWVFINIKTGRPMPVAQEIIDVFSAQRAAEGHA
jgi:acyl-CoA thioester hydrolase